MTEAPDGRPALAIGHAALHVRDIARSTAFFETAGLRLVEQDDHLAILELRGGTHVILLPAESEIAPGTAAPFDLMADDLPATHARFTRMGLAPSPIENTPFHQRFTVAEPSGYALTVNSSHVRGRVV